MSARHLETISLTVSDIDRLVRFHANAFGAVMLDRTRVAGESFARLMGIRDAEATVATLAIGAERILLVAFDERGLPNPPDSRSNDLWFQHFAIVTADIEPAWARARAAGATPIGAAEPVTLPAASGGVRAIKFRDPDGHPLELLQFPAGAAPPRWATAAARGHDVLGVDHSAIAVADTARSEAFYVGLLGLDVATSSRNVGTEQEALDGSFNAVVDVTGLDLGDASGPHVEFLCNRVPATGRPIAVTTRANDIAATRLVIAVDDLDAVVGKAIEERCRFVSRDIVPQDDGSRAAMLADPDGHFVVLNGGGAMRMTGERP